MIQKQFPVISGTELMDLPYRPIDYIVDGLLSPGLTLLAGSPKTGKSFLVLWLCLCVAKGEPFWGFSAKQGTTLYLCLEDTAERIQHRAYTMVDDIPANIFFSFEAKMLDKGLKEQVHDFMKEHPDTVLLVIDTFQCIRQQGAEYSYANDYAELKELKKLADHYGFALILVHHLRKQDHDDSFQRILGTTGIQGATDSCFVMTEKQRGSGKVKFSVVGRDIEPREIELERDENNIFQKVSDSLESRKEETDKIVFYVQAYMDEEKISSLTGTPKFIAEELSASSNIKISELSLFKRLKKNEKELFDLGFSFESRRSNGLRFIEIRRNEINE